MFDRPREPLKEYLQARHAAVLQPPGATPSSAWVFWNWCLAHWDFLYYAWVYGLAFVCACWYSTRLTAG